MEERYVVALGPLPGRVAEILAPDFVLCMPDETDSQRNEPLPSSVHPVVGLLTTVADRLDPDRLRAFPSLRAVATASAGTDHLDLAELRRRHIPTASVPTVLTETTADLAWALLLAAARRLGEAERTLRAGRWEGWSPLFLTGTDVYGKTLGIVGMGRIGSAVARRAQGFSMRVQYAGRHPSPAGQDLGAQMVPLDALLSDSDLVILCLPGGPSTRGLIGERELRCMKDEAVLVNIGRGDVLDLTALCSELDRGRFTGVGLDVYPEEPISPDHPLLHHERVVLLPHIGSATRATRIRMAEGAALALKALLLGRDLPADAVRIV